MRVIEHGSAHLIGPSCAGSGGGGGRGERCRSDEGPPDSQREGISAIKSPFVLASAPGFCVVHISRICETKKESLV